MLKYYVNIVIIATQKIHATQEFPLYHLSSDDSQLIGTKFTKFILFEYYHCEHLDTVLNSSISVIMREILEFQTFLKCQIIFIRLKSVWVCFEATHIQA